MKLFRLSIIILVLLLPIASYATLDYLSVNKITKEYYWGGEDNPTGWIGWKRVPEGQFDTAEDDLEKLGYSKTYYPFKIESYIALSIGVLLFGLFIIRKNKNKLYTSK